MPRPMPERRPDAAGPTVCRFSGWTVTSPRSWCARRRPRPPRWSAACRRRGESRSGPGLLQRHVRSGRGARWLAQDQGRQRRDERKAPAGVPRRGMDRGRGHAGRRAVGARLCASRRRQRAAARPEGRLAARPGRARIVACDGEWLLLDYEMRNDEKLEPLAPTASGAGVVPWHLRVRGDQLRHALGRPVGPAARRFAALFMPLRRGPAA